MTTHVAQPRGSFLGAVLRSPRTLVVKADGSRKAVSGALDAGRIARLMD